MTQLWPWVKVKVIGLVICFSFVGLSSQRTWRALLKSISDNWTFIIFMIKICVTLNESFKKTTQCILMSEPDNVPSLMMMTSIVSEESLAGGQTNRHRQLRPSSMLTFFKFLDFGHKKTKTKPQEQQVFFIVVTVQVKRQVSGAESGLVSCHLLRSQWDWWWGNSSGVSSSLPPFEDLRSSRRPGSSVLFCIFLNCVHFIVPMGISHGKFGSLSPRKASCNSVALPNPN